MKVSTASAPVTGVLSLLYGAWWNACLATAIDASSVDSAGAATAVVAVPDAVRKLDETVNAADVEISDFELEMASKAKQDCYDALFFADRNGDRKISEPDYVFFVQILGPPGFALDASRFSDLPEGLRNNFRLLSCLCLSYDSADCCSNGNGFISNRGAFPGEVPTDDQDDYLSTVCQLSQASVDQAANSAAPTRSPTATPIATSPPTGLPTSMPTREPTTPAPTAAPSSSPSGVPTRHPTEAPTTLAPTSVPTRMPSVTPSEAPTDTPTHSPTRTASAAPTSDPSGAPTPSPSSSPSSNPTAAPSAVPTSRPSTSPSHRPSFLSSAPPTVSNTPTSAPSPAPSAPPTESPSNAPSVAPTVSPTSAPSPVPTALASSAPSVSPQPSSSPSGTPSSLPTHTAVPTETPSSSPTEAPTASPAPTSLPTPRPLDAVARTQFLIGLVDGNVELYTRSVYVPDLEASLDEMSSIAESAINESGSGSRRRRRLSVTFSQSTIDGVIPENCPSSMSLDDRCEEVSASIGIYVDNEDSDDVQEELETFVEEAVDDGTLQSILESINPNTPVQILGTAAASNPNGARSIDDGSSTQSLRAGPIVGFVAVGLLLVLFVSVFLARRQRAEESNDSYSKQPYELAEEDHLALETGEGSTHMVDTGDANQDRSLPVSPGSSPGRTYMTGGSGSNVAKITAAAIATGASGRYQMDHESASAGSSGWSSRDGLSSVDESSHTSDDVESLLRSADARRGVTSNAQILQAASFQSAYTDRSGDADDSGDEIATTFSELDQAIHRGDWAAVGVTAALLASRSTESASSGPSVDSPLKSRLLDANRAAELDRLVAAGDWEAVVNAASRFDAEENLSTTFGSQGGAEGSHSTISADTGSVVDSTGSVTIPSTSFTGTSVAGNTTTTNDSRSRGSTDSRKKRRSEYRAEVESLVRRVVPEEADNIDEMMLNFRGKEEELVETLRSMHERQVAKKARLAGHKQAKRAARNVVEDRTEPVKIAAMGSGSLAVSGSARSNAVAFVAADGQDEEASDYRAQRRRSTEASDDEKVSPVATNLLTAIESGDWDQVAAVGAKIDADGDVSSADMSNSSNSSASDIDSGEVGGGWAGVVTPQRDDSNLIDEEKKARRLKRLQEEEEALAQADIWIAIAEQTKTESQASQNPGASQAADWAIARSLNALVQAQDAGQLRDSLSSSSRERRSSKEAGKKKGEV